MNPYILERHINKNMPKFKTVCAPGVLMATCDNWASLWVFRLVFDAAVYKCSYYRGDGKQTELIKPDDLARCLDFIEKTKPAKDAAGKG